ncbi:MAG: SAM-dependent methyltransferase [Paludibacter sp.]
MKISSEVFYQHFGEIIVNLCLKSVNMNVETQQFISENIDKDIHQLALQSKRFPMVDLPLAIRQINGKQKIRYKVPSFYNNENILYPVQLSLEQSSSETTATYKSTLCEGNVLVDLTGGFGVDCFFMASHFQEVEYVERQTELCELARHNFQVMGGNHITVINEQTEKFLYEMQQVDWIFIDPARRSTSGKKVVLLSDCEPDVSALSSLLLEKSSKVMIKLSPMMDISAALSELPNTSEIHIISVENECKEILFILSKIIQNDLKVKTINFGKKKQNQIFEFELKQEATENSIISCELGKYLYEPNAAVMKSGAFKLIGNRFNLLKLHINTHLYTSNEFEIDFPGRIFEVKSVWGNGKNEWKNEAKRLPKANISTRNYPIGVDDLRKKLKISDGGDNYLFACTLANEQKVMIECKKRDIETSI